MCTGKIYSCEGSDGLYCTNNAGNMRKIIAMLALALMRGTSGLNDQIHSVEKGIIEDALKKNLYICRGCTTNRYFSTGFYVQMKNIKSTYESLVKKF